MATNPWDMDWSQPQQSQAPAAVPGFIPGRAKAPDPLALAREERLAGSADRAAQASDRAATAAERQVKNDERRFARESIGDSSALRKEFDTLPDVKDFNMIRASRQQIRGLVLNQEETAGKDIGIIFSYMKMLDPGSVVREGEYATAQNSGGIPESLRNAYNKAIDGTRLTQGQRLDFAKTAENIYGTRREQYNSLATKYRDLAQRQGTDPDVVARRYVNDKPDAQPGRQGLAPDEEAVMGFDTPDAPGPRLSPEQDAELRAFVATKPTADALSGWFAGKGFGGLTPESATAIADAAAKGQPIGGVDYAKSDAGQLTPEEQAARREAIVDPALRGVADTVSLGFADEISAAGKTVFSGGTMDDNLRRERAIDAFDEQNNPIPRIAGQIAGGFALPTGGATTARQLATLGGGYGAAYGFGSTDGSVGDRLLGAAGQGALGAAVGGGAGALLNRARPAAQPNQVADAMVRQNVQGVSADVLPQRRNMYSMLESMPVSGGQVQDDLARLPAQMEQRVEGIAGGPMVPRETAGQSVIAGAERYVDRSRNVVSRLYDRAATESNNAQITPTGALQRVDDNIAELSQTPSANATKLRIMNQVRADLVDDTGAVRPLGIQSIRDLRTAMRDELATNGLRYSDTERRVMDVIDAASTDIRAQLRGPALRAFDRADRAYRERAQIVDTVVEKFIGANRQSRPSGAQVMSRIENAARPRSGDETRLTGLLSRLNPNEAQDVRQSIAGVLGRRGDDAENAFTANQFFSQIGNYSDESLRALYGQRGADDLLDLKRIAEARVGTLGRMNNSGSGRVGNWRSAIGAVLSGGGAGAGVGALTGFGAGAGAGVGAVAAPALAAAGYITARIMGSPRAVQAIANAARANNPGAIQQSINGLSRLATRDPSISADIIPIRDFLQQAIAQSPTRAAAQGQDENNGR